MKRRRSRGVAAGLVGVSGAVLVVACLESLPPPTACEAPARVIDGECVSCDPPLRFVGDECRECPPPAVVPDRNCLPTLDALPTDTDGCIGEIENGFSCLAGDPQDCACDPEDCDAPLACFDDATCPREVLESAPNATCIALGEDAWSYYVYPLGTADHDAEQCICGCMRCAAKCDGKGTIFGVFEDSAFPLRRYLQGPAIDLRGYLPESGKLGFYIRGRGWAGGLVAFVTHDLTLEETDTAYYVPILNDFSVPIAYGPTDEGGEVPREEGMPPYPRPYAWSSPGGAPSHVILALTTGLPSSGLVEIDCVIPFVEPYE